MEVGGDAGLEETAGQREVALRVRGRGEQSLARTLKQPSLCAQRRSLGATAREDVAKAIGGLHRRSAALTRQLVAFITLWRDIDYR